MAQKGVIGTSGTQLTINNINIALKMTIGIEEIPAILSGHMLLSEVRWFFCCSNQTEMDVFYFLDMVSKK